jgi:hypothetical protein
VRTCTTRYPCRRERRRINRHEILSFVDGLAPLQHRRSKGRWSQELRRVSVALPARVPTWRHQCSWLLSILQRPYGPRIIIERTTDEIVRGRPLVRKLLAEMASLATPETILRWYGQHAATKYDGTARRHRPNRRRSQFGTANSC